MPRNPYIVCIPCVLKLKVECRTPTEALAIADEVKDCLETSVPVNDIDGNEYIVTLYGTSSESTLATYEGE